MKTNFDIDSYLRYAEEQYYYGADGFIEEEEPKFNRKRILLLCR